MRDNVYSFVFLINRICTTQSHHGIKRKKTNEYTKCACNGRYEMYFQHRLCCCVTQRQCTVLPYAVQVQSIYELYLIFSIHFTK